MTKRRVLITGGAGNIAGRFARSRVEKYEFTLLDLPGRFEQEHEQLGTLVEADVAELDAIADAFRGVDTVLHFGGERRPGAPWSRLLPANIVGSYNVVVAAMAAGCRRVIYASSVHVVSGHADGPPLDEYCGVHPSGVYGATKAFGEALGAHAASQGLSFIALRIGAYEDETKLQDPANGWMLRDYCHPEDLHVLVDLAIEDPSTQYAVYNAVSANAVTRLSIRRAREELGFQPRADAFEMAPWLDEHVSLSALPEKVFESGFQPDLELLRSRVAG